MFNLCLTLSEQHFDWSMVQETTLWDGFCETKNLLLEKFLFEKLKF